MIFMKNKTIKSVFIDSSAWISYVIPSDSNFPKAGLIFKTFTTPIKLFTSLFIIDETVTRVRKLLDQFEASKLYRHFVKLDKEGRLIILPVENVIVDKAVNLLEKYPTPNTFSLTDATNIILIQKHKIQALFSFDSDFKKLKIPHLVILP